MKKLIDRLANEHNLPDEDLKKLIENRKDADYLIKKAGECAREIYGRDIFIRGLIEISNFCKNDCKYCGIRRSNKNAVRYRLSPEKIISCCKKGYDPGFRTFVLQGGEDPFFTDDVLCDLVKKIKENHPDCAVTLSLGEREAESYKKLWEAGADRYLLRHETASDDHYRFLHPEEMLLETRLSCLNHLKELGYQTGCGFMVGSPGQTVDHIVRDLRFIKDFKPQMVGIGPFIPHKDTPFAEEKPGSFELTVYLLAIIRLLLPNVLLPATTALGTINEKGREEAVLAGANVVMPNLSPEKARENYTLYDGKLHTRTENADHLKQLSEKFEKIGYKIVVSRGDFKE